MDSEINKIISQLISYTISMGGILTLLLIVMGGLFMFYFRKDEVKHRKAKTLVNVSCVVFLAFIIIYAIINYSYCCTPSTGHPTWSSSRILADIKETQTALELYYNDTGVYPEKSVVFGQGSQYCLSRDFGFTEIDCQNNADYMLQVPPGRPGKAKPENCPSYINYVYTSSPDRMSYELTYCLEEDHNAELKAGPHTATPEGLSVK